MKRIITFGTFDLLHIGHIRIIQRAAAQGNYLVVGVSSDSLNFKKKQCYPAYLEEDRVNIIKAIKGVDEVFLEESLEKKEDYIKQYKADALVMGDDWKGKFDHLSEFCEVIYLPRTPAISTTYIKKALKQIS